MSAEHITIAASNLNIAPTSATIWRQQQYQDFLHKSGFDSFEWSDVRFPFARHAALQLAGSGLIGAVHESWREKTLPKAAKAGVDELKIAVALPLLDQSYKQLNKIQARAGRRLPIVVHPNGQHLAGKAPDRPRETVPAGMFSDVWFQPTAEWAASHNIPLDSTDTTTVAEQIVSTHIEAGLHGMAVDLHHLTAERHGLRFKNPGSLAVALVAAPTFRELQVALRPDFGANASELAPGYTGKLEDTVIGRVLEEIASSRTTGQQMRIVSEIPASAIFEAGHRDLAETHAVINNNIRSIFS